MVHETGLDKPKVDEMAEDEIAVDEPGPHQHNDLGALINNFCHVPVCHCCDVLHNSRVFVKLFCLSNVLEILINSHNTLAS